MAREWVADRASRKIAAGGFALHAAALAASQALAGARTRRLGTSLAILARRSCSATSRRRRATNAASGWRLACSTSPFRAWRFVWLRSISPHGLWTAVWLLCVVWATDSAAYVAGSAVRRAEARADDFAQQNMGGRNRRVSRRGALRPLSWPNWSVLSPIAAFVGAGLVLSLLTQCGDLAESVAQAHFRREKCVRPHSRTRRRARPVGRLDLRDIGTWRPMLITAGHVAARMDRCREQRPRRKVTILGSTGSVGVNTIDLIEHHNASAPGTYRVTALTANANVARTGGPGAPPEARIRRRRRSGAPTPN